MFTMMIVVAVVVFPACLVMAALWRSASPGRSVTQILADLESGPKRSDRTAGPPRQADRPRGAATWQA